MISMRWTRVPCRDGRLVAVAVCLLMLFIAPALSAPRSSLVKVAYLYNFAKFVEWPKEALARDRVTFSLCILGTDSFVGALPSIQGKPIKGKKVAIEYFSQDAPLGSCHILFVSSSEAERVAHIVKELQQEPVLTVADMEEFTHQGGMINFITQSHKIRFAINVQSAMRAGLHVRSKLLKLAHIVDE